jgi:CotH kinase protein
VLFKNHYISHLFYLKPNKEMKKINFLFVLFTVLFFLGCSTKEDNDSLSTDDPKFAVEVGNSEIPYIKIVANTTILNEPKVAGEMTVFIKKEKVLSTNIGIEYRGSTSYRSSDKKSFGIETRNADGSNSNISVLGLPAENDWILMADVFRAPNTNFDPTLMHHYLGYELFRNMGNYASRSKFVEVEINGVYKGIYILMEKLKKDANRINIETLNATSTDITGGYILKIDKTTGGAENIGKPLSYFDGNWDDDAKYNATNSFRSNYTSRGQTPLGFAPYGLPYHSNMYLETYFLYEYPSANEISVAQKTYIQNYIHDFETALLADDFNSNTRTYTNYIDLNSFADFFIINEVCSNGDGYRLSTYMHKNKAGKLKMGPIWDLNIGFNRDNRVPVNDWIANFNNYQPTDAWQVPFWWKRLLQDPIFKTAVKARWTTLRTNVLSTATINNLISNTANYLNTNNAIGRNYNVWTGVPINYDANVNALKSHMTYRLAWMDGQINNW